MYPPLTLTRCLTVAVVERAVYFLSSGRETQQHLSCHTLHRLSLWLHSNSESALPASLCRNGNVSFGSQGGVKEQSEIESVISGSRLQPRTVNLISQRPFGFRESKLSTDSSNLNSQLLSCRKKFVTFWTHKVSKHSMTKSKAINCQTHNLYNSGAPLPCV